MIVAIGVETLTDEIHVPLKLDYGRNRNFTGRQEVLQSLHSFISSAKRDKNGSATVVIHGTGGIGKTQLVREYAYAHEAAFTSIIWINAESFQSTQTGFLDFMQLLIQVHARKTLSTPPPYARIARQLNIAGLVDRNGQIILDQNASSLAVIAVKEWLRRDCNSNWLLIFDNVDDLESFSISDFFPNSQYGCIILTSRRPECVRLGHEMHLDVMDENESITLLSKSYLREISVTDDGM